MIKTYATADQRQQLLLEFNFLEYLTFRLFFLGIIINVCM